MEAGSLTVAASSRAGNKGPSQGTLLLISNEIDQTNGMIQLKATFPNRDHALWPGQCFGMQLLLETRHNAVTVPSAAVQLGPRRPVETSPRCVRQAGRAQETAPAPRRNIAIEERNCSRFNEELATLNFVQRWTFDRPLKQWFSASASAPSTTAAPRS